jgi:hypothetical protein
MRNSEPERRRRLARKLVEPTGKPCVVVQRTHYGSSAPKTAKMYPGTHPDWSTGWHEPGWMKRVPMITAQEA